MPEIYFLGFLVLCISWWSKVFCAPVIVLGRQQSGAIFKPPPPKSELCLLHKNVLRYKRAFVHCFPPRLVPTTPPPEMSPPIPPQPPPHLPDNTAVNVAGQTRCFFSCLIRFCLLSLCEEKQLVVLSISARHK